MESYEVEVGGKVYPGTHPSLSPSLWNFENFLADCTAIMHSS